MSKKQNLEVGFKFHFLIHFVGPHLQSFPIPITHISVCIFFDGIIISPGEQLFPINQEEKRSYLKFNTESLGFLISDNVTLNYAL